MDPSDRNKFLGGYLAGLIKGDGTIIVPKPLGILKVNYYTPL